MASECELCLGMKSKKFNSIVWKDVRFPGEEGTFIYSNGEGDAEFEIICEFGHEIAISQSGEEKMRILRVFLAKLKALGAEQIKFSGKGCVGWTSIYDEKINDFIEKRHSHD